MVPNKLSIIVPFYNEEATLEKIIQKVISVDLINGIEKQLIFVDDCSSDNSPEIVKKIIASNGDIDIKSVKHEKNKGKGSAIHAGIKIADGDYLIIQDADLEYDPEEYNCLLEPVIKADADVVYGSRFAGGNPHRILFFWHSIGNKFLTGLSNMFTNLNLTDMETCYKLFRTDLIKQIPLKERKFGFEPEITAKIARIDGVKVFEVGISYYGRTYKEGKKINWKDGFRAIYCILKYNLLN